MFPLLMGFLSCQQGDFLEYFHHVNQQSGVFFKCFSPFTNTLDKEKAAEERKAADTTEEEGARRATELHGWPAHLLLSFPTGLLLRHPSEF